MPTYSQGTVTPLMSMFESSQLMMLPLAMARLLQLNGMAAYGPSFGKPEPRCSVSKSDP